MIYRITEQTASVIERSYDIEADSADEAQEWFEDIEDDGKAEVLIHAEIIRKNVEITGVEEVTP